MHGTSYYPLSVPGGFRRHIVHGEMRTSMSEADVESAPQRAREEFPIARPRLISDNGPQFLAKEFICLSGMTHLRTSPYYPRSNGKQERWHTTLKRECVWPGTLLRLEDARRIVENLVKRYNTMRLHSATSYVTPKDKLEGRAQTNLAEREQKFQAVRERRVQMWRNFPDHPLTGRRPSDKLPLVGETDASSAGGQLARDSRPGRRAFKLGEYSRYSPSRFLAEENAQSPLLPYKTPGAVCLCVARRQGAESQDLVTAQSPGGPESFISVAALSSSR